MAEEWLLSSCEVTVSSPWSCSDGLSACNLPVRHDQKLPKTQPLPLPACSLALDMHVGMQGTAISSDIKVQDRKKGGSTWGHRWCLHIFDWFREGLALWSRKTWKINNWIVFKK